MATLIDKPSTGWTLSPATLNAERTLMNNNIGNASDSRRSVPPPDNQSSDAYRQFYLAFMAKQNEFLKEKRKFGLILHIAWFLGGIALIAGICVTWGGSPPNDQTREWGKGALTSITGGLIGFLSGAFLNRSGTDAPPVAVGVVGGAEAGKKPLEEEKGPDGDQPKVPDGADGKPDDQPLP